MTDRDNITMPREAVEKIHEAWSSEVYPPAASTEWYDIMDALRAALAAEPTKPEDADAIIDAGKKKHEAKQEPVAAQHRFRRPEKSAPDWGPWHACKVSNRPAWEIDSQGWLAEYRPLYTVPPDAKALRRDAERYRWLREKDGIAVDVTVFGSMEANIDAAIDAAMKEDKT